MSNYANIRTQLEEQAASLSQRVQKIEAHLRGVDREAPDDWSDRAQFLENDEVLEALDEHDRATLSQIRTAIGRIDSGDYGECAGCGESIPVGRLKAVPFTTVCVSCAA
ncbi:MAG: TraR/DksA family transcriptional regulator [Deltaproteobacteria bacterium]|nr:TraR/DksA family transcriptional regulator [Deltaproteobacteria bacterium]